MNKSSTEAQENIKSVIQRIATGPELSKNISRDEAKSKNQRIELYDLKNDPFEINNIVDQFNYRSLKKDLYEHLKLLQKLLEAQRVFQIQFDQHLL